MGHQLVLALSSEKKVNLGSFSKRKAKTIQGLFPKHKEQYIQATHEISNKTGEIVTFSEWIQEIQEGQSWFSKRELEEMLEKLKELAPVFKLPK